MTVARTAELDEFLREERAAVQRMDELADLAALEEERREADPDGLLEDEALLNRLWRE